MCRMCECYIGGIAVMDVIWRRLCVNMIRGRVIYLFCSAINSINLFPLSIVSLPNGLHRYCSWYASYVFDSSVRPGL